MLVVTSRYVRIWLWWWPILFEYLLQGLLQTRFHMWIRLSTPGVVPEIFRRCPSSFHSQIFSYHVDRWIKYTLSLTGKDCNYLCNLNVGKWWEFLICFLCFPKEIVHEDGQLLLQQLRRKTDRSHHYDFTMRCLSDRVICFSPWQTQGAHCNLPKPVSVRSLIRRWCNRGDRSALNLL